jgi:hypothetical protein
MLVSVSVCALPCGPQDSLLAEQPVACGLGSFGYALSHAGLTACQSAHLGLRNTQRGSSPPLGANPLAEVIYGFHARILAPNATECKRQIAVCAILVRWATGGGGTIPVPH